MSPENPFLINNGEARANRSATWSGIKTFGGEPLPSDKNELLERVSTVSVEGLRENMKVWRPEETVEAAQIFFAEKKLRVVGPPQSGKGTIIFGLSEICDAEGWGYVYMDGHHQEVTGQVIAETIDTANKSGIPVFFDSTDYLFLRSRARGRDISRAAQEEKVPIVMEALRTATVPVAITTHDGEWVSEFLDTEMLAKYEGVLKEFPTYQIPLFLSEPSAVRFLKDHKIPPEVASAFYQTLSSSEKVRETITASLEPSQAETVHSAIHTYPVLKELSRQRYDEFLKALEGTIKEDPTSIIGLSELILKAEENRINLTQTRKQKKAESN